MLFRSAAAALNRAQRLMAELQLDHSATTTGSAPEQATSTWEWLYAGPALRRVDAYRYRIASILDTYFFVQAIWVATYLPDRDANGMQLELSGRPEHVQTAGLAHDQLHRLVLELWREYQRTRPRARGLRAKNQYIEGLLRGFES